MNGGTRLSEVSRLFSTIYGKKVAKFSSFFLMADELMDFEEEQTAFPPIVERDGRLIQTPPATRPVSPHGLTLPTL